MDDQTIINREAQRRAIETRLHWIDNGTELHYKSLVCQAPNNGGLVSHSHDRLYTSGANMDGRRVG